MLTVVSPSWNGTELSVGSTTEPALHSPLPPSATSCWLARGNTNNANTATTIHQLVIVVV